MHKYCWECMEASLCGVVAEVVDCDIGDSEIDLQPCYNIPFLTNSPWEKVRMPLFPHPAMG